MAQKITRVKCDGVLALHHRVITTGTTGWMLKLLFADQTQRTELENEVLSDNGREDRLLEVLKDVIDKLGHKPPANPRLRNLVDTVLTHEKIRANHDLTDKLMPLPSGPNGGDVLIADEVLNNGCHSLVFLHDPTTSHPHNDDIRLLERTCQIPGVFAECVSDEQSAEHWVQGLKREIESPPESVAQDLRNRLPRVRDVVLVDVKDNAGSEELGRKLARATAGYFHHRLLNLIREKKDVRIGVAWGWGATTIFEELERQSKDGVIAKPAPHICKITWSPLIGILAAEVTADEAYMIAARFKGFYGGDVEAFPVAGFAPQDAPIPDQARPLISKLEYADIILTSASPWNDENGLYKNTALKHECLPTFEEAVGLISGVFLDRSGRPVKGQYSVVGLDYGGFQRAASRGAVILMCGGENRNQVLLSALRGQLVSVAITTTATAKWILAHI